MYKDIESLFINPMLPLLVITLVDEAFQDYNTFEEIKDIPLLKDKFLYYLYVKSKILHVFFF